MPQKTRGAANALHHIYSDIKLLRTELTSANKEALDAVFVRDRMIEAIDLLQAVEQKIRDGIEPLLERQAPQYETRLATLEEQMRAILEELRIEAPAERQRVK